MNRSFWLFRGLKFILFAALFIAAAGYLTMGLWNWLVPTLFHGPFITFWQTLGLLLLTRILFGGWGRGGRGAAWARQRKLWKQKMESRMAGLTPEEQEKFRLKMQGACGPAWMRRRPAEEAPTTP
ncbi:hypothetical protein HNQ93_003508 [Hymenobacter luteus]|uniref:DUF1682 domain-containing protein n=2 Tax=Hymenobacter TaxID=89966 RepID=A0A7W9T587_9BACT|nr:MULTISPECIES: hypothetical protein [Hymenobacter]MBB4602743.1 hypothetical protein [Hymenobacter latericoloratus]MBB6060634.1 hypothetical protein [Hymenobacter luteus]